MEETAKLDTLKDLSHVVIETERLLLIPVSMDYVDNMLQELTDEVTKYMAIYPPDSKDEEIAFVKRCVEKRKNGTELQVIILDKNTKEYLGGCGISRLDTKTPTLGIWIKKSTQGQGMGKEAVCGLKNWADEHLNYDYFIYPVDKNNIPSRKIPESLGGIVVSKEVTEFPSGKKLDEVIYHIPKTA